MRRGFFGLLRKRDSGSAGGKYQGARPNMTVFVFVFLFIISFLMLLLSSRAFMYDVKSVGLSLFSGVRNGIHELTSFISRTVLSISELSNLRKEHADLLKQLDRFEELERSNAEIYQENIRLREQLDFARTLRYRRIPAQISGKDPDNLFSAVVINKGSVAGVSNDMAVVAWQNGVQALVGKVIQTGAFESLVMPVYDINSLVSSRFSVSRFEGIVEGQGSSETPLLMRFVPRRAREEIYIGDIVVTSGMGGIYPAEINIGRVSAVNILEYETTLEVEINHIIDFSKLEYVFVIEAESISSSDTGNYDD
ncbi:MAG: rod shape-determining protein MreC [Treponema sp.]|nr:rod shape-determining protein MreC [Treponema sp.]MCL2251509.1 rod shape-determining protein MreC [Treponema sp.]